MHCTPFVQVGPSQMAQLNQQMSKMIDPGVLKQMGGQYGGICGVSNGKTETKSRLLWVGYIPDCSTSGMSGLQNMMKQMQGQAGPGGVRTHPPPASPISYHQCPQYGLIYKIMVC